MKTSGRYFKKISDLFGGSAIIGVMLMIESTIERKDNLIDRFAASPPFFKDCLTNLMAAVNTLRKIEKICEDLDTFIQCIACGDQVTKEEIEEEISRVIEQRKLDMHRIGLPTPTGAVLKGSEKHTTPDVLDDLYCQLFAISDSRVLGSGEMISKEDIWRLVNGIENTKVVKEIMRLILPVKKLGGYLVFVIERKSMEWVPEGIIMTTR